MTHPLFRQDLFIETAFARRFQAMLRSAWSNRSWHVIVADPGAGKTTSIRDLRKTAGGCSILASLETVYRELFPQLNLRQWTGFIYTWLTQSTFDPTNSGRVTMDYLMKLVTTALEWSYQAGDTEVRAETLEQAASLLVLRRDTLRIIDGEGPSSEAPSPASPSVVQTSETETEQVSSPQASPEPSPISPTEQADQPRSQEEVAIPAPTSTKCTFLGVVPIDIKRFEESGVSLVECPDCGRTWTLSPRGGVVRFKSHDKRKTNTPVTSRRWTRGEGKTDWDVVGGE